ncbi:hypothetical protein CTAYLR_001330 [Chrysophaeum taylorii]|uniref:Thiopurine S-methyltransferase n=1 Tax=Chrysophaeum taylorii TaxID=2483200 RepID=A0AAD7U561_9STRA|nr:hypothetical protein CTAYLR_001330 [Chrysophaeum taylorii]
MTAVESEWSARWAAGRTTFHLNEVHPALVRTVGLLRASTRILVPLCGKSVDLAFFAERGLEVVGVDCVPLARAEFVNDHGAVVASSQATPSGELSVIELPSKATVRYVVGNFFALDPLAVLPDGKRFQAAWDRAGIVAVDPADRPAYVRTLARNVESGGRVLLVAVEHPPFVDGKLGPPFNISEPALRALANPHFEVERIHTEDRIPLDPFWSQKGCAWCFETTYILTRS